MGWVGFSSQAGSEKDGTAPCCLLSARRSRFLCQKLAFIFYLLDCVANSNSQLDHSGIPRGAVEKKATQVSNCFFGGCGSISVIFLSHLFLLPCYKTSKNA
jgi:hypothetical protein